jgi:hypothetical protein
VSEEEIELDDVSGDIGKLAYEDVTELMPDGRHGMLGRYTLCFELASGGMGKVYLAKMPGAGGFEKIVALKRIHAHLGEEREFVDMFLDEARLASRIDHPNVCSVFDFGGQGREYYIAMEHLLGETLSKVWQRVGEDDELGKHRRWWAMSLRMIAEACEGLHAAHELTNDLGEPLHVVHRDVSPWNLFVTYDGAVKVMDFGVARAAERIHQTRTGQVKGHYAYMAPEQARNEDVDRRADVWSLGVILWELLTLKRLFDRDTEAATIMAVVHAEVRPPSSVRPALPQMIDEVVLRALRPDPKDRYPTAREMGRELEKVLAVMHESVGKSELAAMMGEKFSTERARRQRILVDARTLEAGRVLRALEDQLEMEVFPELEGGNTETRIQVPEAPPPPIHAALTPIAEQARPSNKGSILMLVVGVAGGVALSAGLFVGLFFLLGEREPTQTARAPIEVTDREVGIEPPARAPVIEVPPPPPEPVVPVDEPVIEQQAIDESLIVVDEPAAEESEAEPARPVRRAPGTVAVVTPGGWAEIYLRGRRIGRAPGRVSVPSGVQTLTLRPFGNQPPRSVRVVVPAGGTARVSIPVR